MKKIIPYLFLLMGFCVKAQTPIEVSTFVYPYPPAFYIPFENDTILPYFHFDTTQGNLWQIGKVQKLNFDTGYYSKRSLSTDTLNSYPINNYSSFTIKIINHWTCQGTEVGFNYRLNSDTINDGGLIEISHNNGTSWLNIINDPLIPGNHGFSQNDTIKSLGWEPGFSGNSGGWKWCDLGILPVQSGFNDTILLRFTFASDSVGPGKDGWEIDNLDINVICESVPEYSNNNLISIFPNPATTEINFRSEKKFNKAFEISIYNNIGQKVKQENIPIAIGTTGKIDVSQLKPGIYFVNFKNENFYASKKITIQR